MMKSRKYSQTQPSVVLGVDPGFDRMGVAISHRDGLLFSACIEADKKLPHEERLLLMGRGIESIIKRWKPTELAIETLFFNQNSSTALKVAEARGIVVYEASRAGLRVYEYSPQAVKIAVTGYGKADKPQIENMARKLVKIEKVKVKDDEIDAIALCITHLATQRGI